MSWSSELAHLRNVLAALFFDKDDARRVAQDAGIPLAHVALKDKPLNLWQSILEEADKRDIVGQLIKVALQDYPNNEWLKLAQVGKLRPAIDPDQDFRLDWRGPAEEDTLEKIIGNENTMLPIRFLEMGLRRSSAVCRVTRADDTSGTGFLIAEDVLLTNHHVLPTIEIASRAIASFNFEESFDGLMLPATEYRLQPSRGFVTNVENDWTAVFVQDGAVAKWGVLQLSGNQIKVGDRVNIVQHPGGGMKQIGMYHNSVVFVDDPPTRVQYLTDTTPGSSGAPVFDRSWNVVALHHSGGWLTEPGGKAQYFRNEGIAATQLRTDLKKAGVL